MSLVDILLVLCAISVTNCEVICDKAISYIGCHSETEENVLQSGIVSDDEYVTYISLSNCHLTDIQQGSFDGLPAVETIDLSVNDLATINLGVLDKLNSVTLLNLSNNALLDLPLGIFDQMTSLVTLDLNFNKLSELTLGVLDPPVYLRTLTLRNNQLKGFPLGLFDKVKNLIELDISYNDMSELVLGVFDSMSQLEKIDLTSSKFGDMPSGIFDQNKELKELILGYNGIEGIPDKHFNDLRNLERLDLRENKLAQLQEDVFKNLHSLKYLNLSKNSLTDATATATIQSLVELDISSNKINKMPEFNLPVLQYLDLSSNEITNFGQNVGMNIPKKLKVFKLHKNPWQCACLDQVLGILRRRKIDYYYSSYFQGKKPVCVLLKDKLARCFRDNSRDQQFVTSYYAALKKYPGVI